MVFPLVWQQVSTSFQIEKSLRVISLAQVYRAKLPY